MTRARARLLIAMIGLLAAGGCATGPPAPPVEPPLMSVPTMPPPNAEALPPSPGAEYTWVPGHWVWRPALGRYMWIPGHYTVPPASGLVWVPGHWMWGPMLGYHWVEGYWRAN